MAYVEIKTGKAVLQTALSEDAMSLGRLPGNYIVINDPDISRRHCVIERLDGKFSVYDLGSRNGTKVNGERIQRVDLGDGDVISIGTTAIRFVDATLQPPGRRRSPLRALAWLSAVLLLLAAAFLAAWAMGLLGERFPPEALRRRLGLPDATQPQPADKEADVTATPIDATPPTVVGRPASAAATEPRPGSDGYQEITPEMIESHGDRIVGRLVSAQFVGRPTKDHRGVLQWELPPDGTVVAVLEASAAEGQAVLETLVAEPMLLEVRLSGRIERDPQNQRLLVRVGAIEVLHAWGGKDESLQAATKGLIGQLAIINPGYTAQRTDARD